MSLDEKLLALREQLVLVYERRAEDLRARAARIERFGPIEKMANKRIQSDPGALEALIDEQLEARLKPYLKAMELFLAIDEKLKQGEPLPEDWRRGGR